MRIHFRLSLPWTVKRASRNAVWTTHSVLFLSLILHGQSFKVIVAVQLERKRCASRLPWLNPQQWSKISLRPPAGAVGGSQGIRTRVHFLSLFYTHTLGRIFILLSLLAQCVRREKETRVLRPLLITFMCWRINQRVKRVTRASTLKWLWEWAPP